MILASGVDHTHPARDPDIAQNRISSQEQNDSSGRSNSHRPNELREIGIALRSRFDSDGVLDDLEEAISCLREALHSTRPDHHPSRLTALLDLVVTLRARYRQMGRLPDLNDPIAFLRDALLIAPDSHPERPRIPTELANALLDLAKWSSGTWDDERVVEAIALLRDALALAEHEPESRAVQLNELAKGLRAQYSLAMARPWMLVSPPVALLEEAIALHRQAMDTGALANGAMCQTLTCLALALQDKFVATMSLGDLDEAILLHRQALELCRKTRDKGAMAVCQANLAAALHTRYDQMKQLEGINEAVALHHAQHCEPVTRNPERSYPFNVLQPILRTTFHDGRTIPLVHQHRLPDFHIPDAMSPENLVNGTDVELPCTEEEKLLDADIASHRQALDAQAGHHWDTLDRLGVVLRQRCAASARPNSDECLQMSSEAISLYQEAVRLLPEGDPAQARLQCRLGLAYYTHYTQVRNTPSMESLLDFAIEELEHVLQLCVAPHPDRVDTLDALGEALCSRFLHGGHALDLDNAILMHREALLLREPDDVCPWQSMGKLADALRVRSERVRQPADLDEAILLLEQALKMRREIPPDHAELSHRLGLALHARFRQRYQVVDLTRATELYRTSLAGLGKPSHRRPLVLNDLATALRALYNRTAELGDLDDAIQHHREALTLLPQGHYDRIPCLNSLAEAHLNRSKETGRLADLSEAVELCKVTLQGFHYTDRQNPTRCPILETLGHALVERFLRADEAGNQLQDIQEAIDAFQAIAECHPAPLSQRFPAARMWARLADACDDGHGLALQAYRTTIEFLPLLAGVGADVSSRRRVLTANTDGLAREAAACAIRQRKYKQAVELLEAGRAVFWSQALQLRTPLDDLEAVRPILADKVRELSRELERGALREALGSESQVVSLERERQTAHFSELNAEWLDVVEEIQQLPGFGDFLSNKTFDSLSAVAECGPVVLLIASGFRSECTALILPGAQQDPICTSLDGLTYRMVEGLANKMRRVLVTNAYRSARQERGAKLIDPDAPDTEEWMRELLKTLWNCVARPVLERLHLSVSS